jgi:hypothetical protein
MDKRSLRRGSMPQSRESTGQQLDDIDVAWN